MNERRENRRKPRPALPVAVTVAVLLALYVGAYSLMVAPVYVSRDPYLVQAVEPEYSRFMPGDLGERTEWSDRISPLFSPIHWLDRRIRPHVWDSLAAE